MNKACFNYDGGLARLSKQGEPEAGDDGVLWQPGRQLAVVADGLGSIGGEGMKDIARFLQELPEKGRLSQKNVFEAIRDICHPEEGRSAFLAALFPDGVRRRRLYLRQAGDCMAVRVSGKNAAFERLLSERTWWGVYISQVVPDVVDLTTPDDLLGFDIDDLYERLRQYSTTLSTEPNTLEHHLRDHIQTLLFPTAQSVWRLSRRMRTKVVGSLHGEWAFQEPFMREARVVVSPGDRYALCSDGVFPDVLTHEEYREALSQDACPQDAAFRVIDAVHEKCESSAAPIDDVSVVVVDVHEK